MITKITNKNHVVNYFFEARSLRKHIRTVHEGHKDHKCESCNKSFSHAHHLRRHIHTIHEGHKDYKCESCGKTIFSSRQFEDTHPHSS